MLKLWSKRPCSYPGCPKLTSGRYCEEHAKKMNSNYEKAGFLVLDKNGMPYLTLHWEKRFEYALGKYNRTFKEELPKITPHVCRHTYCTNRVRDGVSPKTLQCLMGYEDIRTTLQYYTHLSYEDVEKEMRELEEKLRKEV